MLVSIIIFILHSQEPDCKLGKGEEWLLLYFEELDTVMISVRMG